MISAATVAIAGQACIGKALEKTMTIEGIPPHVRSLPQEGQALRATPPPAQAWNEELPARTGGEPHRPLPLRATLPGLHHRALQNPPVTRANLFQPGEASTDSQLANALEKAFGMLHPFFKDGRLTSSSLQRVAAERTGENEALDQAIQVVREILKRPRLTDAIFSRDGDITRDSLRAAAEALPGNSSPSVFSQDPFHAQSNAQVVQALVGLLDQLSDKTQARTFLFELHRYVAISTLEAVMQDPYAIDTEGAPVLDPATGMPRPQYDEFSVYTAKNILERPGLLPSLERANSPWLFGPPQKKGWLSKKNLELWLEQDKARKLR